MKNRLFPLLLLVLAVCTRVLGQGSSAAGEPVELATPKGMVKGTLLVPVSSKPLPVVLIIAGSGPTDRNGNSVATQNNSLKLLAEGLHQQGIATLRYDKRGSGESISALGEEKDLRFDDYVTDATHWVQKLKMDKRFNRVVVMGHSEGSLIGMLATQQAKADAFVSLSGPGQPADKIIRNQLLLQPKAVTDIAYPALDSLKLGKTVANVNPMLGALLRPSVQPYLISWFKYDPQVELKKLTVPVLLVQGDQDLQVPKKEADLLLAAAPKSKLVVLSGMNHVLKEVGTDYNANVASYKNPELPLASSLVPEVSAFVKGLK
ncbi:alpha/beta hydrolase [Rufibacter ruber]|uniref:alpha/beta hydrolase n=1 Tax=Rufibacter ruber TaxID=1783499 RepID=UPI00083462EB|nr:alpha/beta fold hydrolase [Rufibacter ruber]